MTIKTHYVGVDGEKAADTATTQAQINAVTSLACALVDPESGRPLADWRWANDSSEARTAFQLILWDRRVRVDQYRATADRTPFAILTELDGAVVRLEFYEGRGPLKCTFDLRSAALLGKELPKWTERDLRTENSIVFLGASRGSPPELDKTMSRSTHSGVQEPDTLRPASSTSRKFISGYADETMGSMNLLDRRVPQRGWEQEYGVPFYLIGAADVLYFHRKRVANPDVAVIDAAIVRLFGPWVRRAQTRRTMP